MTTAADRNEDNGLGLEVVAPMSSLRARVIEALRAAIIAGNMRPGVLYSAPALSETLGVSATPVREAMQALAREGLVDVVRNRGFRVAAVAERTLDELVEIRLLIEAPTMGAIAEAYDSWMEDEFTRLRQYARDMEAAADSQDLVRYMQLDTEFHMAFLALHGNSETLTIVRNLRSRSRLYGLKELAFAGQLTPSTREHMQMIELAVSKDREGLEDLTRRHIRHARTIWAGSNSVK
jgi:DNA-binding GntR family transcriptional regulator